MTQARTGAATLAIVVLIGTLWGLNWPAVKFMLTEMPPLTIRAAAFPLAAGILAVIAIARGQRLLPDRKEWLAIAITGLLVICGFNVLTTLGQVLIESSKAAIIAYAMPAMTAGLAAAFLGERLGLRGGLALLAGMAGICVLVSENFSAIVAAPAGPLIMLLAALSWALGNVMLKGRTWELEGLPLTVWFFVVSTLAIWPLVLIFEPPWEQSWPSMPVLATLLYHALGPMVICYALWTALVDRLPASVAAITALLAPVVGVVSSLILLGEPTTWQKLVALALILVSITLVLFPAKSGR